MPSLFQFALIALTVVTVVSLALCLLLDRSPRSERPAPAAAPKTPKPEQGAIVTRSLHVPLREERVTVQPEPASLLPRLVPPLLEEHPVTPASVGRPPQERLARPLSQGRPSQERSVEPVSVQPIAEARPPQERPVQPPSDGWLRQERDAALERGDSLWDLVVHLRDQVEQLRAERHAQEHEIRQLRAQLSGVDSKSLALQSARIH